MDSLISTFHIDWKIIIAQAINFAIVFFVLYRYALRPLGTLMEERKNEIEKGLSDAKINADTLSNTQNEYANALLEARKEANEIVSKAKKDAQAEKEKILASAKLEAEKQIAQGKNDLANEKVKMIDEAKKELASLVISATEKVLDGTLKSPISTELIEKSIKEAGK